MPRISQHFNPFTKIGNPSHLLPKRFRGSTASKEKEGLAARRASISPNSLPRQEKAQTGLHTTSLKLPSFKKISNFASRSLTKIAPQGLSKQEKIHQAFLKAGYDPHGPMAEALKTLLYSKTTSKVDSRPSMLAS